MLGLHLKAIQMKITKLPTVVFLIVLPMMVHAQFAFTTNNGTITITGYSGPGGAVVIPDTTNGFPVTTIGAYAFEYHSNLTSVSFSANLTAIGEYAFEYCSNLTSVGFSPSLTSIGDEAFESCLSLTSVAVSANVTNIGYGAFSECLSLTNVTMPSGLINLGGAAFYFCLGLTSVTIPNNVRNIGQGTFFVCENLTNVTIGSSVASIGYEAFFFCTSLTNIIIPGSVTNIANSAFAESPNLAAVYFQGNSPTPTNDFSVFTGGPYPTMYYLPGTTGWGQRFDGCPTSPWTLPYPIILNNGAGFGGLSAPFGFTISWATNLPVVVEACTDLANPAWSPLATNTLTSGTNYFADPQWTNYPGRFYRIRSQ
jgi:hypothetical protein